LCQPRTETEPHQAKPFFFFPGQDQSDDAHQICFGKCAPCPFCLSVKRQIECHDGVPVGQRIFQDSKQSRPIAKAVQGY
jgi:hypothetical protein